MYARPYMEEVVLAAERMEWEDGSAAVAATPPPLAAAAKAAPRRRSKMSAAAAADLASAKAAFDAYIGDAATETWPVEDLLPLSLRATFLSSSSCERKKLLKWRRYAYPAAAFDPLVSGGSGRMALTENAFTEFGQHVKSFAGCASRRVKVGLATWLAHITRHVMSCQDTRV